MYFFYDKWDLQVIVDSIWYLSTDFSSLHEIQYNIRMDLWARKYRR
jgi:hypothetical protein